MAIGYGNLGSGLQSRLASEDRGALLPYIPAKFAINTLLAPSDITADDTVTIAGVVFQCKALTTDSTRTASLNNSEDMSLLTLSGASGTPTTCVAGDLLRIDNEIVKIMRVITESTVFVVARHRCGTTVAAHAAASVYQASAVSATNVPFGVNATLTPAVWVPSLVAEINNARAGSTSDAERPSAKASTIFDPGSTASDAARAGKVVAAAWSDRMTLTSAIGEASVLACTDGLTAAGNIWVSAAMRGGAAAAERRIFNASRVPVAGEVTLGKMDFAVPFTPTQVFVRVVTTATGVTLLWVGGATYDADKDILTIDNTGGVPDWATTDTVHVLAIE